MRQQRNIISHALVAVIAFVAGGGFVASVHPAGASSYSSLNVFAKVLAYVENSYVEETDPQELIYGAIEGMVATLDSHTAFLPADEFRDMREDTSGAFGGLGIELRHDGDQLVVIKPLEDSPAPRSGILAGDRILAIDGAATGEMTMGEAVRKMRGPPGSKVRLMIFRESFEGPLELVLLRDRIHVRSVEAKLHPGGVGYIKIKSFQEKTENFLAKALQDLRQENGAELSGLVLDLRSNPGGLLDQAVRIADRFLREGDIVTTKGRKGKILDIEKAHAAGTEPDYPMVVLVNEGSASASEVVAGALQDHGRAVLLGTKTYGKGSVQTVIDLDDGSGLKLTVAKYYTPNQRTIHGTGLAPDLMVTKDGDEVAPLVAAWMAEIIEEKGELEDFQLHSALATLQSWEALQAAREAEKVTAKAE